MDFRGSHGRKSKRSNLEDQDEFDRREWEIRDSFAWENIIRPDENDLRKKRRWAEMDHDILINIIKLLSRYD